ncbi:putative uncharacterized protein DDB_G0271606 [Cyclospora cayetanensis]|uniref:Clathrin light chain n=1 Tax=Cyclospora cayetanensis TaxID=88456 RepID=A0A6P6S3T9_9EIME|nr:putative uncharacterized protein DDB_G0271606 [Cyclospora cayetanensis]
MAAAHDDFFNGKSSEFDLVQQDDDFLLDSVEQPEALPVQAVQQAEQRQREKLNNGIDFSAADSPGDREKRDERQLGRSDPFDPFSTEETSFPSDVFGAAPPRAASAREASELGQPQGATQDAAVSLTPEEQAKQAQQMQQQQQLLQQRQDLQQQLQGDIEIRQREEQAQRQQQQQIADEEIRTFYEQRERHLERRKAQLKYTSAAAGSRCLCSLKGDGLSFSALG